MTKNFYLKKTCGIYVITHTESGRQYCGQSVDCFERWKQHSTPKKGSTGIKGAIMKWGVDAFSFQILEECSKEELNERETWWISELCTLSPAGYNLTGGGGQGTVVSAETRAALSAASTGRTHSPETKAKMSAGRKGKTKSPEHCAAMSAGLKGRTHSPETRAKLSAAKLGKPRSPEAIAAAVEGRRRSMAARKEAQAYAAPLQKLTDTLRHDKTYIPVSKEAKPPAGPQTVAPPTLAELEALLQLL